MTRLIPLSTLLFVGSMTAAASGLSEAEIAACKADIRDHYGTNTVVKLVSSRPYMDGTRVLLAADVGPDELDITRTYLATCWAPVSDTYLVKSGKTDHGAGRGAEIAVVE